MRKVVLFMHISLDGFAAGPNGELDWISYDEELEKYAEGIVSTVGSPLYGRVTYQMMENYWPTAGNNPNATKHEVEHSKWYSQVQKVGLKVLHPFLHNQIAVLEYTFFRYIFRP